ncbi:MAG: MBL fold metallo-hydrolase [bacterium]
MMNIQYNTSIRERYLKDFIVKDAQFGKVLGSSYTFIYLVDGILFDSGVSAWAYLLCQKLKNIEWDKKLFLTHSHYDHLGGVGVILSFFNDTVIYGSERINKVLNSQNALKTISEFDLLDSQEVLKFHNIPEVGFSCFELSVPISFSEGQRSLLIEGVEAINTPGHTKDTISYYIASYNCLVMSESMGVPNYKFNFVLPEFLTSYTLYVESFKYLKGLVLNKKINNFLLPHIMYFEYFSDVVDFIRLSEESLKLYVSVILEFLNKVGVYKGLDEEVLESKFREVFTMMVDRFYVKYELSQPIHAFEANVTAQIKNVFKELV